MSIRHTCECGADIRLPHTAARRKARCKSCGVIFTVPPRTTAASGADRPGRKLPVEARAGEPTFDRPWSTPESLDLSGFDSTGPEAAEFTAPDSTRDDLDETGLVERSFWFDLAGSFLFFIEPGNLVTWLALAVATVIVDFLPLWGWLGLIIRLGVDAYILAFPLATVREIASGEDELPSVWIHNLYDDLFEPALEFVGTGVFVMLLALALACWAWWQAGEIDFGIFAASGVLNGTGLSRAVPLLVLVGLFFWPAVMLAVAIGHTFSGLWPHVIVRTPMGAPLAYMAICAALVVAATVSTLPAHPRFVAAVTGSSPVGGLVLRLVGTIVGLYSSIVAMWVIGLFYRHYKDRLPWTAE
jgi:hypothetical protein